jgi:hypothetical protein
VCIGFTTRFQAKQGLCFKRDREGIHQTVVVNEGLAFDTHQVLNRGNSKDNKIGDEP